MVFCHPSNVCHMRVSTTSWPLYRQLATHVTLPRLIYNMLLSSSVSDQTVTDTWGSCSMVCITTTKLWWWGRLLVVRILKKSCALQFIMSITLTSITSSTLLMTLYFFRLLRLDVCLICSIFKGYVRTLIYHLDRTRLCNCPGRVFCMVWLSTLCQKLFFSLRINVTRLSLLRALQHRRKTTLQELQSVISLLSFACHAIESGRCFLRRLIDLTVGVSRPHHHIRIAHEARYDICA